MSNNQNLIIQVLKTLFQCFCSDKQNQQNNSQQQQQPQQQYNDQNAYPPQNGMQHPQKPQAAWNGQNGALHQQNQNQQNQGGYKPSGLGASAGYLGSSPIGKYHGLDDNAINSTNSQYTSLRNSARQEADSAHQCFAQSQQAYKAGDGARAHELSEEGKKHMAKKDQLDGEASAWIYQANNLDSPPNTVDLHGLYVKEAIAKTSEAIEQAQRTGVSELQVIVGKGNHSANHVAKVKPAIEELMQKYNLSAHVDPHNSGVLIVDVTGRSGSRDAGGLMRDINGKENDCVIM